MKKVKKRLSRLRFNFGYLLEGDLGARREIELDYPSIEAGDDVTLSPLQGKITATRTSKGIYLSGRLQSNYEVDCTRCLDTVVLPIEIHIDDLLYHPPSTAPAGEYTIDAEGIVDLAPLIREYSLLAVPMQVLCRPDCKGICVQCGQNLNEDQCACEVDVIDPRLSTLGLLLKDEPS